MKCPYCIKVCSKCKRILVANKMNFVKVKKYKYGLSVECKICRNERSKQYYENNKEEINEKHKQYNKEHKEERKEYLERYREEHKEEISEYDKRYREEHKEEISKRMKQYNKEYYKNNPDKVFNKNTKRRQLEESQGNGVSKEQWLEMMNFFDWKCAYSGESLYKNNRTIDHILPLSEGGENEVWNLVPMLKLYNCSKYTKNMEEWYKKQPFYSIERLNKIYEWIEYAKNKWGNQVA